MEKSAFDCRNCQRKTYQNLSNRCQYCGAELPAHMKMDEVARATYLHELEDLEKESEAFARGMSKEMLFQQDIKRKKRQAEERKTKDQLSTAMSAVLPKN